ncbi:hypothetical protein D3C86_1904910 [compost metagenome]
MNFLIRDDRSFTVVMISGHDLSSPISNVITITTKILIHIVEVAITSIVESRFISRFLEDIPDGGQAVIMWPSHYTASRRGWDCKR